MHLTAMDVAAYVDGALDASSRARVRAHLAECDVCRQEIVAVLRLVRPSARKRWIALAPLAAAAVLVVYLAPWRAHDGDVLREPAITSVPPPTLIAPRAATSRIGAFVWSSVPHADRYLLTVFARDGTVLWRAQTQDTSVAAPSPQMVRFELGSTLYWKVSARIELNRWVNSEFAEFSLPSRPRPSPNQK
jgi:Putative zinc-finger